MSDKIHAHNGEQAAVMGDTVTCTIVARNYLAHARVLAASYAAHHRGDELRVLVVDDREGELDDAAEPFVIIRPEQLGLAIEELHRMAAIYDVTELSTALKPFLLRHLIGTGARKTIYLDPDIKLFADLGTVERLLDTSPIVLIPHTRVAVPDDGRKPTARDLSSAGIYNLGFIAVADGAQDFLDWWSARLRRDCIVAPEQGLFVDQRVIDATPARFQRAVIDEAQYNVAYWNLHERAVRWSGDHYQVDGQPLVFFHFSGFDPHKAHVLSRHQGDVPRILLSEHPALARLCSEYASDLLAAGYDDVSMLAYGFAATPTGLRLDRRTRRIYRAALINAEAGRVPAPPNPFDLATDGFLTWLRTSPSSDMPVNRYLLELHSERPDLQKAFPLRTSTEITGFLDWAINGAATPPIPVELSTRTSTAGIRQRPTAPADQRGVNVVGYLAADLGVGENARLTIAGLRAAQVPYSVRAYRETLSRQSVYRDEHAWNETFDINIVHVNADVFTQFAQQHADLLSGRRTIAAWTWEIEDFPLWMARSEVFADEIWAISSFAADAIRRKVSRPVYAFAPPIIPPGAVTLSRDEVGLPTDRFVFLFCFDFLSVFERKNPLGLIEAFEEAFAPGEGPVLMLKAINGDKFLDKLELLRVRAAKRPDILVHDGYVSRDTLRALMAYSDAYVSLHRAEGYGLTMGEAMALGKPVIATGYSGNLDFMTHENSILVPYTLAAIPVGCDPYPAGALWAEPDLVAAAESLRLVFNDEAMRRRLGEQAASDVREHHSPASRARFIHERLDGLAALTTAPASSINVRAHPIDELLTLNAREPTLASPRRPVRLAQRSLIRALRPLQRHDQTLIMKVAAALQQQEQATSELREQLSNSIEELRNLAATHGGALDAAVQSLSRLDDELHAIPYMADPATFEKLPHLADNEVMGYSESTNGHGSYAAFADTFRGPEEMIRARQAIYPALIGERRPVVDLGCGRGEFLDLARVAGIPVQGVDSDDSMAERCRAKGHAVVTQDAIGFLESFDRASLGAIVALQFVEHLTSEDLGLLLDLAFSRLRRGGLLIAETVNPHALNAYKAFWTDLTHEKPIFPETALALCRMHGFPRASVIYPLGTGDLAADRRTAGEYALLAER